MVFNDSIAGRAIKDVPNGYARSGATLQPPPQPPSTLLTKFIQSHKQLDSYRNGKEVVKIDGQTLSIAAVAAAARYNVPVELDGSAHIKDRVAKSRAVISQKVESGASVYGLSTGFGGSADTRTDQPLLLGKALLQHQQTGVLPSADNEPLEALPLLDPGSSSTMPESWVRGAMLIRMNSLIRGHSGVRWELVEKINELLSASITPVVPLRGSISASGDLSPLSYIAGSLVGNPSIRVFDGPATFGARKMVPASKALAAHNIEPITLASKEPLGILNGTAFSASVAALAMNEAVHLSLLGQVCTAMGTEALSGTRASYDSFIHATARPHPGQVESAQNIWNLLEGSKLAQSHEEEIGLEDDKYSLRQDRYPLRTSPQFLGPQIEDILSALAAVTQECNSTTDNPLINGSTGEIHHGGNFQAMAITNAMEKTRLALHHIGKLLFAQSTELVNPAMNNGLPPSLAATDPSLNYHTKGADIATAAYVAELGYLANPVSTHIQSAEMHNQAVNSLALISARATLNSLDVLSILTATYLYILCQALDLRTLRREFDEGLKDILSSEFKSAFRSAFGSNEQAVINKLFNQMTQTLDKTSTMDAVDQMNAVASSCVTVLVQTLTSQSQESDSLTPVYRSISEFCTKVSARATESMNKLRASYLSGERGATPASPYLGKTKLVYEYIRVTLGVKMHGADNLSGFSNELGENDSIGQKISLIHEAIRDGKMQKVVVNLFESCA
ncbi:phenylalanine ammonia-lyase [Dendrothele bispora CBS 962.96]|uniref:Phenylalanine ammonia-lyase n=1 Tax=Dendrothele bispora (strain CBS 962.96) TaxID=1314807 RepID=A0A4S8MXX1_DENBC|nr:phenylalanine ammonia-lyase [Dendrothele bispora CBS 962.96]